MKILKERPIFILIALLVILLHRPLEVRAGASPPVLFPEALMWQHIVELNDLLVVARYELTADGTVTSTCGVSTDWDDCSPTDAFVDLLDEDGELIERRTLPRLGPGLIGFYLTAAEMDAFNCAIEACIDFADAAHNTPTMEVYSSPIRFVPNTPIPRTPAIQPSAGATLENSRQDLASQLVRMVRDEIQDKNKSTGTTNPYRFDQDELVEDGRITLVGRTFITAISPIIVPILPHIFQLSGSLLTEAIGYRYQAFLSANALAGATTLTLVRTSPFAAGQTILIRDTANFETAEVISIDSNTQITIDTDPDTGGNQGLANAYSTANLAHAMIVGSFSTAPANPTRDAFNTLMNFFGVATWVGGFLFLTLAVIGVAAIGGSFAGSWVGGLGILPIILLVGADAGILQEGLVFVIALFMLLGGGIMYAKGVGR